MDSVERVKNLCKDNRIPISRLEKDLGYSNGYIGQLRKGIFPADRLQQIADYFGVTFDYLLTGNCQSKQTENILSKEDERDISKDLDNIRKKLATKEFGPVSYNGQMLSEESAELFLEEMEIALKRLKLINKEKYNPHKNKK